MSTLSLSIRSSFNMSTFCLRSFFETPHLPQYHHLEDSQLPLVFFLYGPYLRVIQKDLLDQGLVEEYFCCLAYLLCLPYFMKIPHNAASFIFSPTFCHMTQSWEMTPPRYTKSSFWHFVPAQHSLTKYAFADSLSLSLPSLSLPVHCTTTSFFIP